MIRASKMIIHNQIGSNFRDTLDGLLSFHIMRQNLIFPQLEPGAKSANDPNIVIIHEHAIPVFNLSPKLNFPINLMFPYRVLKHQITKFKNNQYRQQPNTDPNPYKLVPLNSIQPNAQPINDCDQ